MGLGHSPRIITDGMVLCLDAANPRNFDLTKVEVLVVAGGGGGSGNYYDDGAGGGAGGLIYNSNFAVTPGTQLTANVGAGGAASVGSEGGDGGNSVFGALTAIGGGGGASHRSAGRAGGSGGGSAGQYSGSDNAVGGNGTAGQGFAGGTATGYSGSGGGGASSIGLPAGNPGWGFGGNGGNGKIYSISGTPTYYAGGGGGYGYSASSTTMGGLGGGGNGGNRTPLAPTPGTPNTGGGGGGGRTGGQVPFVGTAAGGSGIIIVRYQGPQKAIGGTVTSVNGDTIHTFTTSGNFTPLVNTNGSAVLGLSDLSGNGNFGDSGGSGVLYSSANGGSLSFDGSNDYVSVSSISVSTFTYQGWVYNTPSGSAGDYGYFHTGGNFGLAISEGGNHGQGGGSITGDFYYYNSSNAVVLNYNLSPNVWVNVASVINGSSKTLQLYINGSLQSTTNVTNTQSSITEFGRHSANTHYFNGRVSNTSIYNRALTAAEILQNFNALRGRFGI